MNFLALSFATLWPLPYTDTKFLQRTSLVILLSINGFHLIRGEIKFPILAYKIFQEPAFAFLLHLTAHPIQNHIPCHNYLKLPKSPCFSLLLPPSVECTISALTPMPSSPSWPMCLARTNWPLTFQFMYHIPEKYTLNFIPKRKLAITFSMNLRNSDSILYSRILYL